MYACSDQTIVYETAAASHVAAVLEGYNVTVFAYGATGEPKSILIWVYAHAHSKM